MDELLIEDKKYVSSKRAAKITGYAKDYVGQLCREGRVPARLVGRSWYVLESALQDHRFGSHGIVPSEIKKETPPNQRSTWEAPRYEAVSVDVLPRIHSHQEPEQNRKEVPDEEGKDKEVLNDRRDAEPPLHDTWQTLFGSNPPSLSSDSSEEQTAEEPLYEEESNDAEEGETYVPIRAIHQSPLEEPIERIEARMQAYEPFAQERQPKAKGSPRASFLVVRIISLFAMLVSISIVLLGSGYLDTFAILGSQYGFFAGITVYDK